MHKLKVLNSVLLSLIFAGTTFTPIVAFSQENRKWASQVIENPKTCYALSTPENPIDIGIKNGRKIKLNRGNDDTTPVAIFVQFIPSQKVFSEISIGLGYPIKRSSVPEIDIDGKKFKLGIAPPDSKSDADRSWTWAGSSEQDKKIIKAMQLGEKAIVSAESPSGKKTVDTYSLIGFTAAYKKAQNNCQ
jgi:hypothetical protein